MKGVSPVVAEVLLIAIVITTSVGIWYWMGKFTSVPQNPTDFISVAVTSCNGTHALVRNVGAIVADKAADIYKQNAGLQGYIDLNTSNRRLLSGNSSYVELVPAGGVSLPLSGTYQILDRDYEEYTFVC